MGFEVCVESSSVEIRVDPWRLFRKRMRSGDRPGLQNRRAAGFLSPVGSTPTRFRHFFNATEVRQPGQTESRRRLQFLRYYFSHTAAGCATEPATKALEQQHADELFADTRRERRLHTLSTHRAGKSVFVRNHHIVCVFWDGRGGI